MRSNSKNYSPILTTLVIIFLIEIFIFTVTGGESELDKSSRVGLFDNPFRKDEGGQKNIFRWKSTVLRNLEAEFIQVGDSSGMYGVKSNIVKKYLGGMEYVNASLARGTGWAGYAAIADYFLNENKNAKYLVLYVTPYAMPSGGNFSIELEQAIGGVNNSTIFSLVYRIPSVYLRKPIQDWVFKNSKETKTEEVVRVMKNVGIRNFKHYTGYREDQFFDFLRHSRGWIPYDKKGGGSGDKGLCGDGIAQRGPSPSRLYNSLSNIKKVADRNKVKMIVMFNPVNCVISDRVQPLIDEVALFKLKNPDVSIPFDFIKHWHGEWFSDDAHLHPDEQYPREFSPEGTSDDAYFHPDQESAGDISPVMLNSHRVGEALKKIINEG
jgi:hypothetical protein